jgi:glycosyltransferase involved in cell wall biosynthesis
MPDIQRIVRDVQPGVTIVVPCQKIGEYEQECIKACLALEYRNLELLILLDSDCSINIDDSRMKVHVTGPARPAVKRNEGIRSASGEIVAFLDSDAYPRKDWLTRAVEFLQNSENVGLLGGPNLTPPGDTFLQQASGEILSSRIGAGTLAFRYSVAGSREVDDLPSCNLIGYKSVLQRVGGFKVDFWPGEDTYLCLEIRNRLSLKLYYSPDVVVYHHRRPLFRAHLRQIWSYGIHRGYFARRFPTNSRNPRYLAPGILVVVLIVGVGASIIIPTVSLVFIPLCILYAVSCGLAAARRVLRTSLYVWVGIMLTHLTYGFGFLRGIFSVRLPEERESNT